MNTDKLFSYAVLALILLGLLFLYSLRAQAVTLTDAQATGWLPAWLTLDDQYRVVQLKEGTTLYQYHCIEDGATKAQWVLRFRRSVEREVREGRLPMRLDTAKTPITPARVLTCFATPPPVIGPKALGEPAYWTLTRTPAGSLDFTTMNATANLAGPVTVGEPCGPPAVSTGYYLLPRLAVDGRVPLAKCQ